MSNAAHSLPVDGAPNDSLPLVGEDQGNRPMWIALGLIGFFGVTLFATLEARRATLTAPAVRARVADYSSTEADIPELYVPAEPFLLRSFPQFVVPKPLLKIQADTPAPHPVFTPATPTRIPELRDAPPQNLVAPPPINTGPTVVFDGGIVSGDSASNSGPTGSTAPSLSALPARAHASRAGDQTNIVPQGTLIAAVLETALDSTQPGQARALVSLDVTNAQGSKLLIPKGSRLFGEYRGELGAGQNRAQVQWLRLVRPDGVTIPLDSPAADALGRSGVKGHVNSFFLQRLGGALLQSTIDIGTLAASRSISGSSVVVALPSNVQGAASQLVPAAPKPRLRIKQGMRIAVFVSRDLDFSGVEGGR